jgi:tetratricopeptide (TPR) repeat protein
MYLAKYYYGKRNYRRAEKWAMQANAIDSSKEESWIIFGKALAKRGHRADALRVLQAYYDRSGSMRVKELIDRIRKGKKY